MFLLSTDSLRGYGLNRIFRFAKEGGFEGLELALDARQYDTLNAPYLNELQEQQDLPIRVVRVFAYGTIAQSTQALELAHAIRAKVVVIEPPRLFDFKFKDWMKNQVPKLRRQYDLNIALKNGPSEYLFGVLPGRSMNSLPDLQNFKEICLDVSNLFSKKIDLMRAYEMTKKYLVHVELSNVDRGVPHSLLTHGIMPLESFLTRLKQDRFPHDISLMVRPSVIGAGDDTQVLNNLKASRKFFEQYMA